MSSALVPVGSTRIRPDDRLLRRIERAYIAACRVAGGPVDCPVLQPDIPQAWLPFIRIRLAVARLHFQWSVGAVFAPERSVADGEGEQLLRWHTQLCQVQYRPDRAPAYRIGRHHVQYTLAHSASGTWYACFDPVCRRRVAVKVPAGGGLPSAVAEGVLHAEVERAVPSQLSPGPVILDLVKLRPVAFLVRSYVPGRPLSDLLLTGRPLPIGVAVELVDRIAAVLARWHRRGWTHAGLSPERVLVSRRGDVAILGLRHLVRSGEFVSLPPVRSPYRPPEASDNAPADPRWNVYTCGMLLWHMVSGQSDTWPGPRIRRSVARQVDRVAKVCHQALATDPGRRPPTAAALRKMLRALRARR